MRKAWFAAVALTALALAGCSSAPSLGPDLFPTGAIPVDDAAASAWVSTYRREHGLSSVERDPALDRVAQAQANAMASANQLSHTVGGTLTKRLAVVDRANRAAAENVSAGYKDLAAALAGWQRSPEHNKNLLYAPIRRIGIAGATAPGTHYKTFWALVMTD